MPAASCNQHHQETKLKKNHRHQQHQAVRTRGLTSRERQEVPYTLWPVQNHFHLALHPTHTSQHKASSSSLLLWGGDWCFPTRSQMLCSAQASHDGLQTSGPPCAQDPREGCQGRLRVTICSLQLKRSLKMRRGTSLSPQPMQSHPSAAP